jgi:GT2 family glycosyltransferase
MIRASLFAELGGLDPDYFLYGDDIDFAFRMRAHGFREILVRDAYVFHEKSMATREYSANYIYTALRSHLIMLSKLTRWYHRPTASVTMIAMSVALAILNRRSGQRGGATAALRAWRDFFGRRWGGFDGLWPAPEANSDSREFPTPSPQPALHAP